ncbi:hypothetical protein PG988_016063 [Apiospora saccharicola]
MLGRNSQTEELMGALNLTISSTACFPPGDPSPLLDNTIHTKGNSSPLHLQPILVTTVTFHRQVTQQHYFPAIICMAEFENNRDGDAGPAKKLSGWDALDEHIRKLQEKYEKEKRGGNGSGRQNHPTMTATVQDTKAATDMAVNQALDSEKKKSP